MALPDDRHPRRNRNSFKHAPVEVDPDAPPSKTRRKAAMHDLQDLGESLIELDERRLAEIADEGALPERLVDAIREARSITAWGARKRQLQFVGKLMRDVDPEPIKRRLDAWAHGRHEDAARQHALENWRERLLAEPGALDLLVAANPTLDRARFRALIARARTERETSAPPHAYRDLFRELKALTALDAAVSIDSTTDSPP